MKEKEDKSESERNVNERNVKVILEDKNFSTNLKEDPLIKQSVSNGLPSENYIEKEKIKSSNDNKKGEKENSKEEFHIKNNEKDNAKVKNKNACCLVF